MTGNFNWCSMVDESEVKRIEHDIPSANQSGAQIGIGARGTRCELGCPDTKTDPKFSTVFKQRNSPKQLPFNLRKIKSC